MPTLNMSLSTAANEDWPGSVLQQIAQETVEQSSDLCQRFLDRQRQEIIEATPTARQLDEHRTALKLMLRFGRALYFTVSDPDYPNRQTASELRGRLLQLEPSWRMFQEPMPRPSSKKYSGSESGTGTIKAQKFVTRGSGVRWFGNALSLA